MSYKQNQQTLSNDMVSFLQACEWTSQPALPWEALEIAEAAAAANQKRPTCPSF